LKNSKDLSILQAQNFHNAQGVFTEGPPGTLNRISLNKINRLESISKKLAKGVLSNPFLVVAKAMIVADMKEKGR